MPLFALVYMLLAAPAPAGDGVDARAQDIYRQLRCAVCEGQSLAESDAELAKSMRQLVRSKLEKGESEDRILAYMVERYGDRILLEPPVKPGTWLLWVAPLLFLLLGGVLTFRSVFTCRRTRRD